MNAWNYRYLMAVAAAEPGAPVCAVAGFFPLLPPTPAPLGLGAPVPERRVWGGIVGKSAPLPVEDRAWRVAR